jgi:hypothetical protein
VFDPQKRQLFVLRVAQAFACSLARRMKDAPLSCPSFCRHPVDGSSSLRIDSTSSFNREEVTHGQMALRIGD